jgi:hypothetical protein
VVPELWHFNAEWQRVFVLAEGFLVLVKLGLAPQASSQTQLKAVKLADVVVHVVDFEELSCNVLVVTQKQLEFFVTLSEGDIAIREK